jgi:glycosyltransferase involved in cell wall biosynthesis
MFADRICELLQNQALRRRMGEAAIARAQGLTAEKMAIRLERTYQALIAKDREALEQLAGEEI